MADPPSSLIFVLFKNSHFYNLIQLFFCHFLYSSPTKVELASINSHVTTDLLSRAKF